MVPNTKDCRKSEKEANIRLYRLSYLQYFLTFEYWTLELYKFKLDLCGFDINGVQ